MTGVSLTFLLSNTILIIGLTEIYYRWYLSTNILSSKTTFALTKNAGNIVSNTINIAIYTLIVHCVGILTWKAPRYWAIKQTLFYSTNSLYFTILILGLLLFIKQYNRVNTTFIILIFGVALISSFYFIKNLLIFVLFLEVAATLYYFFFLYTLTNNNQSLVKLKNLIINYIWLSFFTLIFFSYSLFFFIKTCGTLDIIELSYVGSHVSYIGTTLFFISLLWKLGAPGFHFFKLELYQYLPLETIFFFSIFSLLINVVILFFIFFNLSFLITNLNIYVLYFVILSNALLLWRGLDNLKLFQFLALSSLNTVTTILIFLVL